MRGRIDCRRFGAKAAEGRLFFVRADPGRNCGRGDRAAGFRFEAPGCLVERIAEVVERERLQHQADGIGLVAQRGRAGREGALAGRAAPELDDLKLLLADALAADGMAAAVWARAGRLVCVWCGGWSKARARHTMRCRESLSQVSNIGRLGIGFCKAAWPVAAVFRSRKLHGEAPDFGGGRGHEFRMAGCP